MIIPVGVDYDARRYPVVTFTLIGANIFVFILQILAAIAGHGGSVFSNFGLIPAERLPWTWVTSMFVHGGLLHLVGNLIYLFLFGACVEDTIGRGKFIGFYLAGGVIANAIQVLFSTDLSAHLPIVGASGAISACVGAFWVLLPKSQINFRYFILWFYTGDFWLRAWVVISFWFLLDLLGLIGDLSDSAGTGGVAFAAHLGGTAAGALGMLAVRSKFREPVQETPPLRSRVRAPTQPEQPCEAPTVFLHVNGAEAGPYAPAKVRDMLALGALSTDTLFWCEGMEEWRPVTELR